MMNLALKKMIFSQRTWHPRTLAILGVAKSNGFTIPTTPTINAIDKLVRNLISSGIWDRLDSFHNSAYNDVNLKNFSRINWIEPTGNLGTIGVDLSFTAKGWKAIGTASSDFATNLVLSTLTKYKANSAHYGAVVSDITDVANQNDSLISAAFNNGADFFFNWNTNQHRIQTNANNLDSSADLTGLGFKTINRLSSTNIILTNKATAFTKIGNFTSINPNSIVIFRNSTTRFSKLGISCYSIGAPINDKTEDFRTMYNTFLLSIGLTAYA